MTEKKSSFTEERPAVEGNFRSPQMKNLSEQQAIHQSYLDDTPKVDQMKLAQ